MYTCADIHKREYLGPQSRARPSFLADALMQQRCNYEISRCDKEKGYIEREREISNRGISGERKRGTGIYTRYIVRGPIDFIE